MPGIEFYRGPSQLNKAPIVGIATNNSKNVKTGDMIQTWILLQEVNPISGVQLNFDDGICGDCKHRKGVCYVDLSKAPQNIWKSWKNGKYPVDNSVGFFEDKLVRISSYGDPTAIPLKIWDKILGSSKGFTGYTHQWSKKRFQAYKKFCMASVDTVQERLRAKALGWRTFRIKSPGNSFEGKINGQEIICPASPESPANLTCATCLFCNGGGLKGKGESARKDVCISVHGVSYKINNFSKHQDSSIADRLALPLLRAA